MELTSFILGVCAVIMLLMIAGTSVNYMAFKTLKRDFDEIMKISRMNYILELQKPNKMLFVTPTLESIN